MRHAAASAGFAAAFALLDGARADPSPTLTAEGGGEVDSNVSRVESRPGRERIAASVGRLGAKLDHRGTLAGGSYVLQWSALARFVASTQQAAASESSALVLGDARWLHPIAERPVSAGIGVTAVDASALAVSNGSRTFRSLGADALLVLRGNEDRSLTFAFGARRFTFKPLSALDYAGPAASVRLDMTLWESAGGTRTIDLTAIAGIEARGYDSNALANACPDDAPPDPQMCSAPTSLPRRDRYHRIGADLTWAGRVVAAIGYQLAVTDSNSFGQSFVRHRINRYRCTGPI